MEVELSISNQHARQVENVQGEWDAGAIGLFAGACFREAIDAAMLGVGR